MPRCPDRPTSLLIRCLRWSAFAAIALGAAAVPGRALAEQACGDKTCPLGFTCETASSTCPAIACADDAPDCKTCTASTSNYCVAAECAADTDCGAHMVCAGQEVVDCPAPPPAKRCAPNETCPEPDAPADRSTACTTKTVKRCTPRWELPCRMASDCGDGFTCEEQQSCTCSGSSGGGSGGTATGGGTTGSTGTATPTTASDAPTSAPGVAPAQDGGSSSSCTCAPTGTFACVVRVKACTADADCPTDWTCRDNPNAVCSRDLSGQSGCKPADPAKVCTPPYSNVSVGQGRGTSGPASEDAADVTSQPKGEQTTGTPAPVAPGATDSNGVTGAGAAVGTAKPVTHDGCAVGAAAGGLDARAALGWSLIGLGIVVAGFARRRRT